MSISSDVGAYVVCMCRHEISSACRVRVLVREYFE